MKKRYILFPLIVLFLVCLFAGCVGQNGRYETYSGASRYIAGGGNVANAAFLDVDWVGGQVNLEYSDGTDFSFSEETDFDLESNDNMKMRWYLDGATLRIKYAKSGAKLVENLKKTLTVKIPKTATLTELDVETVSANINSKLNAQTADFETVSGSISVTESVISSSLTFDSVSGEVKYSAATLPLKTEADSVSGNLEFSFPTAASFMIEFDSVSGALNADNAFNGTRNGKYYTVNGGSTKIEADTTSGNLNLKQLPT